MKMNEKGHKIGRFERWEEEYIRENYQNKTWQEIASHLNRSLRAVMDKAKRLGTQKKNILATTKPLSQINSEKLDIEEKRKQVIYELENSPDFLALSNSFDEYELERYKTKWAEIMLRDEIMTPTEKDAVHVMISNLIRMDRYQKLEKEYYQANNKSLREKGKWATPWTMHREFKEANEMFISASKALAMSREQRIKREGDDKITIINLINEFDDKRGREALGREMAAFEYLKNKKKNELINMERQDGSGMPLIDGDL
jgi:hypothetical protein